MKQLKLFFLLALSLSMLASTSFAQRKTKDVATNNKSQMAKTSLAGLKFRSVGPALTSGRISDFAVNPNRPKEYFVATSSGGVWKTNNAGTTFKPIFDSQGSYSIGCVTLDPNNSSVVWVGTGENNNQRSVAYGDGVYKSEDGGKSWKNMGLKNSEHIGSILVDPRNSDVIYVAAIGPLWSKGGDRGLYKSTDGGKSWNAVLEISEHTGINEVVMDPRNPDILYAVAFQRRRHVFTYLGGGPESAIYKSTDGGANWIKINKGLPGGDLGRIGLSISPANPEYIYAIVEATQGKGGMYRSTNQGASWEKRSNYVTSGNYYQEIIADPINPDKVFIMNTYLHHTLDGGKTVVRTGERTKHVDNHCIWINPTDNDHFLVGCDGGIYETWDAAKTWHYKANLPVTQFYKVAVDNDYPFYNIYGGTQDNYSLGGPARTTSANGIVNDNWFVTHGGDGFESQIDPKNPNIVYAQSQYGVLVRYDRQSGEEVGIQPKERKGENAYRWNWDAPLAVSRHKDGRVYFAANKLFRSDDRGNSWEVISEDLTQQINRNELPIMDKIWSVDAVAKNRSTSPYGTIVAFSESPLEENLLFVGTDDGLIQVTNDGGDNWQKVESFPGVPNRTYVNAVLASQHDKQVVYAAFNHHKYGDFKPYLYKSSDQGRTWTSIAANLPERGSIYAIAEDHVDPNLLFIGTEFGVFFSNNAGQEWKQLKAGVPTIAVRDIAIQERDNDLVLGTFGRGFYVLDDYSALRNLKNETLNKPAELFAVRDALLYEASNPIGGSGKSFQGDSYYTGENLPSVAIIDYYVKDDLKSQKATRQSSEKGVTNNPYPSYEALQAEAKEEAPFLLFTIKDASGNIVRKLKQKPRKGLQRLLWNMRYASKNPVNLRGSSFYNPNSRSGSGTLISPGTYTVSLAKIEKGNITELAGPVSFNVKPLKNTTLPAPNRSEVVAFQRKVSDLSRAVNGARSTLNEVKNQLKHINIAIQRVEAPYETFYSQVKDIEQKISDIEIKLLGDRVAQRLDKGVPPSVVARVLRINYEQFSSTAQTTKTHQDSYNIAVEEFKPLLQQIKQIVNVDMKKLHQDLEKVGAPYTPNAPLDFSDF